MHAHMSQRRPAGDGLEPGWQARPQSERSDVSLRDEVESLKLSLAAAEHTAESAQAELLSLKSVGQSPSSSTVCCRRRCPLCDVRGACSMCIQCVLSAVSTDSASIVGLDWCGSV